MRITILSLALGVMIFAAPSQAGIIDRGFGEDGRATVGFGSSVDGGSSFRPSSARVIGTSDNGDMFVLAKGGSRNSLPSLVKLNSSGVPDYGYLLNARQAAPGVTGAFVQPNGSVVATLGTGIVRLKADGTNDLTFGTNGVSVPERVFTDITPIPSGGFLVLTGRYSERIVSFDGDGRWRAARDIGGDPYSWRSLESVTSDDRALMLRGYVDSDQNQEQYLVEIPADLAAGSRTVAETDANHYPGVLGRRDGGYFLVRSWWVSALNPDGTADESFGGGAVGCGRYAGELAPYWLPFRDAGIDGDGRLITWGESPASTCGIVRILADGSSDPQFGEAGVIAPVPYYFTDFDMHEGSGFLVTGWNPKAGPEIRRYDSDGTLDANFGDSGVATVMLPAPNDDQLRASALQADGKLVVAGVTRCSDRRCYRFALARLTRSGDLDSAFGTAGRAGTNLGNTSEFNDVLTLPGRRILAAGSSDGDGVLVMYRENGDLDPAFGADGIVRVSIPDPGSSTFAAAARMPDGDIVAALNIYCGKNCSNLAVYRFDSSGALEMTFGKGGRRVLDLRGGLPSTAQTSDPDDGDRAADIKPYPGGKIVLLASSTPKSQSPVSLVVRLSPDGSVDRSFGRNGIGGQRPMGRWLPSAKTMLVGKKGSIYFAGGQEGRAGENAPSLLGSRLLGSVAKLRSNGAFDRSFGPKRARVFFQRTSISGLAQDRCGRILVSGTTLAVPGPQETDLDDFGLFRFLPDGRPDPSFGEGVRRIRMGVERRADAVSLSIQDDRVLIGGTVKSVDQGDEFGVASLGMGGRLGRCD